MARKINPAHFDVAITYDDEQGYPWDNCDGFPKTRVKEARSGWRVATAPGERIIGRHGAQVFIVDYAHAVKQAKAEGWGATGIPADATPGQRAAAAVDQTIRYMREWIAGNRFYSVVTVTDKRTGEARSLYQVEDGYTDEARSYALETAAELARELQYERVRAYLDARKERAARQYWEARDIATTGAHPAPYL